MKSIKPERFQKIVLIRVFCMGFVLLTGLSAFSENSKSKSSNDLVSSIITEYKFLCDTVLFGERLPLRLIEINPKFNKSCGDLCAKEQVIRYSDEKEFAHIPNQWIKKQTEFNSGLSQPNAKAKNSSTVLQPIKRAIFLDSSNNVHILETRYINYPHQNFKILFRCDSKNNCYGDFATKTADGKLDLQIPKNSLEDSRPETFRMRAEIMFGPREKSRLIVRLFKDNVSNRLGQMDPISSSGEITMKPTDEKIELDVGVDEQLKIYEDSGGPVFERLAAVELKLVCHKTQ